jgi:putative transposase
VADVINLFSRRVVGWSMSAVMTAQLVTDAALPFHAVTNFRP